MLLPTLTEADPKETSEGSIDPLGLYMIADRLGSRHLAPGIRERQRHPRFLTLISAGRVVCGSFDRDAVAADGESAPWQVYEWYIIEGLVRSLKDSKELKGIPGREKAQKAIQKELALSAPRYLKVPGTFGFHGVYRTLAEELGVESDGQLREPGVDLVSSWQQERGLDGFFGTSGGPGTAFCSQLREAVRDGMTKGAVSRGSNWSGWAMIAQYLKPRSCGPAEAEQLRKLITADKDAGLRRELWDFLEKGGGRGIFEKEGGERPVHEALSKSGSDEFSRLFKAIDAYERFSRFLLDAFLDALLVMTRNPSRTTIKDVAESRGVRDAARGMKRAYGTALERLEGYGLAGDFDREFSSFQDIGAAIDLAEALLEHHRRIQRRKPPNGKAPWFQTADDGKLLIRPLYAEQDGGKCDGSYVHQYRTAPVYSFITHLERRDW